MHVHGHVYTSVHDRYACLTPWVFYGKYTIAIRVHMVRSGAARYGMLCCESTVHYRKVKSQLADNECS